MKKNVFVLAIAILVAFASCTPKQVIVNSPDGRYELVVHSSTNESDMHYTVSFEGVEIVQASGLGFELDDLGKVGGKMQISKVEWSDVDTIWTPVYGEKNQYPEKYKQATIHLKGEDKSEAPYQLKIRAYNEGVAFRYEFLKEGDTKITSELTEFTLPANTDIWVSNRAQSDIYKTTVANLKEIVDRPLVGNVADNKYVAIGEAALVDYARMKLSSLGGKSNTLVSTLSSEVEMNGKFNTPWRTIMAGNSSADLLQNNYLCLNLNEPNKIENTNWIKPGKVIREVTLTTKGAKACVDFAQNHKLEYIEFDAGWYGHEYDVASDASTVTIDPDRSKGPLDLPEVVDYANGKNVGVILYINRRAMEKQLDQVLPLYKEWGIKGLKYGFVNVGSQKWTSWLHEAVRKAADYELLVDIHDEYRPTGYSRTFPNLMTQEGIRGDEESPSTEHTLKTLFTRMLVGAGDNTNCYLAPRVDEKMGGRAAQMAKAVLIYSPWQFLYWYDRPEASPHDAGGAGSSATLITETPELAFYDALPTTWDDTRVLAGEIGEYALIARKKGEDWFIGALSKENRTFKFSLDFLEKGKSYKAVVYFDDVSKAETNGVGMEEINVNSESEILTDVFENRGFAIHILSAE